MLTSLKIHNFKTIENFEMNFSGGVYLVTGDNEFGKTTLLNAIFMSITGDRSSNLLRNGTEKGFVDATHTINGKQYNVELKFSAKNKRGKLLITDLETKEEFTQKSALESIFGYNDFDVNQFIELSRTKPGRRKQVNFIKSLLPAEVRNRIDTIDKKTETLISFREKATGRVNMQKAICEKSDIDEEFLETFTEVIPLQPIREELETASKRNADIAQVKQKVDAREIKLSDWEKYTESQLKPYQRNIDVSEKEIRSLKRKLAAAEKDLKTANKEFTKRKTGLEKEHVEEEQKQKKHKDWIEKNPIIDLSDVNLKLEETIQHNQNVARVDEFRIERDLLEQETEGHEKIQSIIDRFKNERVKLVESTPLPIPGLTFDAQQLYLNGVPFMEDEVSTSQIMETCLKLLIALNPDFKMFKISNTNLLGAERFKAIIDFANKNNYQGFLEEVVRGQKELNVCEYIEDAEEIRES